MAAKKVPHAVRPGSELGVSNAFDDALDAEPGSLEEALVAGESDALTGEDALNAACGSPAERLTLCDEPIDFKSGV